MMLLLIALMLSAACGGDSADIPDIDATVEARVPLAKASLVAPSPATSYD